MSDKLRISLMADSLPMPRITDDEAILHEHTWPVLLCDFLRNNHLNASLNNLSRRKRSVKSLKNQDIINEGVIFTRPNLIITQIGVVDAAPRIFSTRERAFLNYKIFPDFMKKFIISNRKKIEIVSKVRTH